MRRSLPLLCCLLSPLLVGQPLSGRSSGAPRVENPWKSLPAGTVLEFKTVTDETESLHKESKHEETTEVWTVVANDGKVATIEVAIGDAKKRIERDLSPIDPLPEPPPAPPDGTTGQPTAFGAPDGQDRTRVAYDRIETPFGTFDGVRIDHLMVMLEAESRSSEWRAARLPIAVKTYSQWGHQQQEDLETRTVMSFEPAK